MKLTNEQNQQVATWANAGIGLSEIQTRIQKEFSVTMTFMDVRFLIDDLNLDIKDKVSSKKQEPAPTKPQPAKQAEKDPDAVEDLEPMNFGGNVSVELDGIKRPGSLVSGSVTFSDGVKADWQVDQFGRLSIIPTDEGYRPSEDDLIVFQEKLQEALQKKGF